MTRRHPDPRPDWSTIGLYPGKVAHAAIPGPCTECGGWVYVGDLVKPIGAAIQRNMNDDGLVVGGVVDLTDVEWIHGDVCPERGARELALAALYHHHGRHAAAELQQRYDDRDSS